MPPDDWQLRSDADRDTVRRYLSDRIRRSYRAERCHRAGSRRREADMESARRDVWLTLWSDFLSYERPPGDVFSELAIQQTHRHDQ
jgi:hypothetical protein